MMRYRGIAFAALALLAGSTSGRAQNPDSVEVYDHRLTMKELQQAVQATHNLDAAMKADPTLARRINAEASGNQDAETLDAIAARLEREPAVKKAITSAGLTPRNYTLVFLSLATTATQRAAVSEGAAPATPAIAGNIKLYEANKAQFEAWGREMAAMQPQATPSPGPGPDADLPKPASKDPDMEKP